MLGERGRVVVRMIHVVISQMSKLTSLKKFWSNPEATAKCNKKISNTHAWSTDTSAWALNVDSISRHYSCSTSGASEREHKLPYKIREKNCLLERKRK
jgi:hypothetical protein